MDWQLVLLGFVLIFPVELPDKTFVASLVLSARYRPLPVWIGVGAAFAVQCGVAVAAGQAVSYLPNWLVHSLSAAMFLIGAIFLFAVAPRASAGEQRAEQEFATRAEAERRGWHVSTAAFGVIFAAEWGDLSQILTVNMVAKYGHPESVFVGALAALLAVSAIAVTVGRVLLRYVRLSIVYVVAGLVCLAFAGVGVYQVFAG